MNNFKSLATVAVLGMAAFGIASHATAAVTFTGQFGAPATPGGPLTWNVYEAINTPFSFKEALAFAATRPDPTGGSTVGHLVTLTNLAENIFVHNGAGGGDRWIGLSDRAGVAPGATESFTSGTTGWAWVTGEPFTFQRWGGGEPNNAGVGEDAAHLRGDGLWNDNASGFGENDPPLTPPDLESTAEPPAAFGFIIEWDKNLAAQPPGFPMTRPDPVLQRVFPALPTRMPGPNGTATTWGILEVRDLGGSGNIKNGIAKLLTPNGTRFEGSSPILDLTDPDTNAAPAGAIDSLEVPFISDVAGVDDNDIQTVIKGTVRVPEGQGGAYTFNVHSDDGFALRILSQATGGPLTQHRFTANRNGTIDEDGTLVFFGTTGDSNTQGVVNLGAGTYDVEFAVFEDGGGAFWEVSTARGDYLTSFQGVPRWILLGDTTTHPGGGPFSQPARLVGTATVKNYTFQPDITSVVANHRLNPTPTAQSTVDEVVLYDGDDLCCGRPGSVLTPDMINEFPNGGNDNFSTAVTGQFEVVNTDGAPGETLTFGLFADDNAALRIVGQDFTSVGGDANAMIFNPEGGTDQWLVADYRTGNTNALGLITLPEGTYNFEAFELEEGGDSGLEVWVAPGDRLFDGLNSGAFFPLTSTMLGPLTLLTNSGLALAAGPGTGPPTLPGDYNGNGRVDAADFVVWRKTDGSQAGYNLWRTNFGRTAGSGLASAAGVPEPATGVTLIVAAGFILLYRRGLGTRAPRS